MWDDPRSTSSDPSLRLVSGIRTAQRRRMPRRRPSDSWEDYAQRDDEWDAPVWQEPPDEPGASGVRQRERTAARPVTAQQRALTTGKGRAMVRADPAPPALLTPPAVPAVLPTDSVPDLRAYHPRQPLLARVPVRTRAVIERASRPWSLARISGALIMILLAVAVSLSAAGEAAQPIFALQARAGSAAGGAVDSYVVPITQLIRCDQYDSYQQCQTFGNASCSAAATTEVLTAWGLPKITIGRIIDEMGSDISPNGGLLTYDGFTRAAAKHGFRADIRTNLTYNQILYIVNTLGWPLIVNVRISYGYYYFFSGGHFLVVTGGTASGLSIADSSEYYIHYLPKDVFYSMFTGRTILLVPQAIQYSLPSS